MGLFSRKKEKSHHELAEELTKKSQFAVKSLSTIVSDSTTTQTSSQIIDYPISVYRNMLSTFCTSC